MKHLGRLIGHYPNTISISRGRRNLSYKIYGNITPFTLWNLGISKLALTQHVMRVLFLTQWASLHKIYVPTRFFPTVFWMPACGPYGIEYNSCIIFLFVFHHHQQMRVKNLLLNIVNLNESTIIYAFLFIFFHFFSCYFSYFLTH